MNNIPVVFTFDKRIILGAAVSVKSLIESAKSDTHYDIYVFHPDIDNKTISEFKKMVETQGHSITFQNVPKSKFKGVPVNKGSWNEIVYYRLLASELLPEYEKIVYSDVDVLFKGDLSEIYAKDLAEYDFCAVKAELNTPNMVGHKYFADNKNEYIYWSGFMVINSKKFRQNQYFNKLMDNAKKYKDELKFFDLDLLNITCNDILSAGLEYCVLQSVYYGEYKSAPEYKYLQKVYTDAEIEDAIQNPRIIHYAGKPGKPWRIKNTPKDYKEYMDSIPKSLKKYTFRDIRKKIFSKV